MFLLFNFFPTVGQNNFGNSIPLFRKLYNSLEFAKVFHVITRTILTRTVFFPTVGQNNFGNKIPYININKIIYRINEHVGLVGNSGLGGKIWR